jgi:hypothetical protein
MDLPPPYGAVCGTVPSVERARAALISAFDAVGASSEVLVADIVRDPGAYADDPRQLVRDFCAALAASRRVDAPEARPRWRYCAPTPHPGGSPTMGHPRGLAVIIDAAVGTHYSVETRAIVFLPPLSKTDAGHEVRFQVAHADKHGPHRLEVVAAHGDSIAVISATARGSIVLCVHCTTLTLMSSPRGWEVVGILGSNRAEPCAADRRDQLERMRAIYMEHGSSAASGVWCPPADAHIQTLYCYSNENSFY